MSLSFQKPVFIIPATVYVFHIDTCNKTLNLTGNTLLSLYSRENMNQEALADPYTYHHNHQLIVQIAVSSHFSTFKVIK